MKRIIHHALVVALVWPAVVIRALSGTVSPILIVRVQVGTANSASEEYVELYNRTESPVDISSWQLQYKSATGTSWSTKLALHGILYAHKHYLLTSTNYLNDLANDHFSPGLAGSAGHVRLVTAGTTASDPATVQDTVGWGSTATGAEGGQPIGAPAANEVLVRKVNDSAEYIDSDNNAADFSVSSTSQPISDNEPPPDVPQSTTDSPTPESPTPEEPTSPPVVEDGTASPIDDTVVHTPPIPIMINELLPNPASPQTDAQDEFIELFNPNDSDVSLDGYIVQTGTTFSRSQPLGGKFITAHGYLTITSGASAIVLSNTASSVRLLGPDGLPMGAVVSYEGGLEGQAWAYDGVAWQWTVTPTPGGENTITAPPVVVKSGSGSAVKGAKTTTKKAASTKSTTTTKAKATTSSSSRSEVDDPPLAPTQPVNLRLIVLAATGAILYGALEYRHDLSNAFYRLRRNRSARRASGASLSWQ